MELKYASLTEALKGSKKLTWSPSPCDSSASFPAAADDDDDESVGARVQDLSC